MTPAANTGHTLWGRLWRYALLVAVALIFIFPVVFMVVSSLKPDDQLLRDTASLRAFLPVGDISLDNYFAAFRRAPVALFVMNSILVTSITVLAALFLGSLSAFAFTFLNWRGRDIVFSLVLATLIIPFETIAIPLLLLVNKLPAITPAGFTIGWLNSYHVQIVPWIADGSGRICCAAPSSPSRKSKRSASAR